MSNRSREPKYLHREGTRSADEVLAARLTHGSTSHEVTERLAIADREGEASAKFCDIAGQLRRLLCCSGARAVVVAQRRGAWPRGWSPFSDGRSDERRTCIATCSFLALARAPLHRARRGFGGHLRTRRFGGQREVAWPVRCWSRAPRSTKDRSRPGNKTPFRVSRILDLSPRREPHIARHFFWGRCSYQGALPALALDLAHERFPWTIRRACEYMKLLHALQPYARPVRIFVRATRRGEVMKNREKRKVGDGRRSMNVIVRVSPELRYLAEIAARVQRRTVSSFAEWAIEQAVHQTELGDSTVGKLRPRLWDVDEIDRFTALAFHFPELLTHEEQVLWKLIIRDPYYAIAVRTRKDNGRSIASNWTW